MQKLSEKIDRVIRNTETTNEKLEKLSSDVTEMKKKQSTTDKRVTKLEKQMSVITENVARLSVENNQLRQQAISRDFVIFGLPKLEKKDMSTLISSIAAQAKIQLGFDDLKFMYPVAKKKEKKQCTIHGSFHDEKLKSEFIKACRAAQPLHVEKVVALKQNDTMRGKEFYVRSQLTPMNRLIAAEARKIRNKGKLKWVWASEDGRIMVRENDDSPIIHLQSTDHLYSLASSLQSNDDDVWMTALTRKKCNASKNRRIVNTSSYNNFLKTIS